VARGAGTGSANDAMPTVVSPAVSAASPSGVSRVLLALLFILGCGLGGGLIAALGLFEARVA